jgi:hypothetical protein
VSDIMILNQSYDTREISCLDRRNRGPTFCRSCSSGFIADGPHFLVLPRPGTVDRATDEMESLRLASMTGHIDEGENSSLEMR